MPQPPIPASGRARESALRERRRAEALRSNLRRRKEQARSREEADETVPSPDAPACPSASTSELK